MAGTYIYIYSYRGKIHQCSPTTTAWKPWPSTTLLHYNWHQTPGTIRSKWSTFPYLEKEKKNTDTYTNIKFIDPYSFGLYFVFSFVSSLRSVIRSYVLWISQLSWVESCNIWNVPCARWSRSQSQHSQASWRSRWRGDGLQDVTQHRETIIWDNWPYPLVHTSKCCLHCCHVLEGKQTSYEHPKLYTSTSCV